ncbi:MAG: polysaccharide ABC transporter ATP-binding protein [Sphaerobacter sp.]|nr:polysaccharide ABC transporter ATP-binding protein [Sphaerobacter sp.]
MRRLGGAAPRGDIAVELRGVSRRFRLHHETRTSFQDWFIGLVRPRGKGEEFWALRDISFSLRRGESLGILGRNGAGKSTLLKLITRVLEPTSGEIIVNGRTLAMLELGAGFHPELSGRDNVYLNGSIYGYSRRQMAEKFDRIVAFAELERFIDTPVKHYSLGMFMRLGFSIAVHLDPDILVIDEVLSVGDAAFQRKGYQALRDLKANGTTILFVSHWPELVREFCDRAILLQEGRLIDNGPVDAVAAHYERMLQAQPGEAAILRVRAVDAAGRVVEAVPSGRDLRIEVLLRVPPSGGGDLLLAIDLYDRDGNHLFGSTGRLADLGAPTVGEDPATRRVCAVIHQLPVAPTTLTIAATLQHPGATGLDEVDRQDTEVEVIAPWSVRERGLLRLDHAWEWEPADAAADALPELRVEAER